MKKRLIRGGFRGGLAWLCFAVGTATAAPDVPPPGDKEVRAVFDRMAERRETSGFWARIERRAPNLASRDVFYYALELAESGRHPERLGPLFDLAAEMQDTARNSALRGNFRWLLSHGAVLDPNAVDFCMQPASLILLRSRDRIPPAAAAKLERICRLGLEGLLRHRVPVSYTNITLLNAQDLLLLGRALDRPETEQEGIERLRRFLIYTWRYGVHEYDSATYYDVDLGALALIRAYARPPKAREWAETLLEYFWTDIAANYCPAVQRLAGTTSRTYDSLYGKGGVDRWLRAAGWLKAPADFIPPVPALLAPWSVPEKLRTLAFERFPREVRQCWGAIPGAYKTHYLLPDVTLGSSGAAYGRPMAAQDMPLTIDFAGPRTQVRGYFIADARRDPYGKKKFQERGGPHRKALHLAPWFAAVQRRTDALALAIYRPFDYPENPATLESHLVMPLNVDEVWIGDRRVAVKGKASFVHEIPAGDLLAVRKGDAALALRVLWTRALDGRPGRAALVYDGNPYRAMRLTIAHHTFWGDAAPGAYPGAALWVRIGDHLAAAAAFAAWRKRFQQSPAKVEANAGGVRIEARSPDGPLAIEAKAPFLGSAATVPPPAKALIGVDGRDMGRQILRRLAVCRNWKAPEQRAPVIKVAGADVAWEAESGAIEGDMRIGHDDAAFGGAFVWAPGEIGGKGGGDGSATWRLEIAKSGRYYLWGRVLAPTPEDDSFYVRVFTGKHEILGRTAWHLGLHRQWGWAPLALRKIQLDSLELPAGTVYLQVRVRENGAKLDRLFLSRTPSGPQ